MVYLCLNIYHFDPTQSNISLGVDSAAKIGVAGDSAGASISASVCQTVGNVDFQALFFILCLIIADNSINTN